MVAPGKPHAPLLKETVERPLRYTPDGSDFVIENGREFFNRPLYGPNTAFRIDAGDKPECSLFLPGRGGNVRFGIKAPNGVKWFHEFQNILARYRPGSMQYELHDPILSARGSIRLALLPTAKTNGLIAQIQSVDTTTPLSLIWAFGGANGDRGRRNGDIGCEFQPVSQFFQLKSTYCRGNRILLESNQFRLDIKAGSVLGLSSTPAQITTGDAKWWNQADALLAHKGEETESPLVLGETQLQAGKTTYLALFSIGTQEQHRSLEGLALSEIFAAAEEHRKQRAQKVVVDTPDPFINSAVAALCVAADGIWDEQAGVFMHGAVAWRNKLLGWRGPYAGDALGWHERTQRHLSEFASMQNTEPIPARIPSPEATGKLTRNETALHSNGDLSHSHYDMNLVAMDAFFRHLLWTGDLGYAREMWPVLQRHLAWEKRLFRRTFGPEQLPLYEAYCCIWASDDLQYNGGGVAHATAYNYYQNKMAAQLAKLLGEDSGPYEKEADLIQKAMRQQLWLPVAGAFAECKDYQGLQLVHPNYGLWTFYITMDSGLPNRFEAWQMSRSVETQFPHIPLSLSAQHYDKRLAEEGNYVLPTSTWMPYLWSVNNVVMAESAHTSLGLWQAGRPESAFPLFKGCLLNSMFIGLCPGNVGMCTCFDTYRGESQRDFGDGIGATSRALIEGLFGIVPNALSHELVIRPGFPLAWEHASLKHQDLDFDFQRHGVSEHYFIKSRFTVPMSLRLQLRAIRERVDRLTVNGQPGSWKVVGNSAGEPRIEIQSPAASAFDVQITWVGNKAAATAAAKSLHSTSPSLQGDSRQSTEQVCFTKLTQGELSWWSPQLFETHPSISLIQAEAQNPDSLRFTLRNNTSNAIAGRIILKAAGESLKKHIKMAPFAESQEFSITGPGLVPGSNPISVLFPSGEELKTVVVNWQIKASWSNWTPVDLSTVFNDRLTHIFQNQYVSPRSPFCSLAMPTQGIGGWCDLGAHFEVDDSGLRAAVARNGGKFALPQGITFQLSAESNSSNILFTSRWDNYPSAVSVPVSCRASHAYFLLAGSCSPMQSRLDNGELIVAYADGSTARLALRNPETWWPINEDFYTDDFAFSLGQPLSPRIDLKTGLARILNTASFKGKGGTIPGGVATVLDLPLDASKLVQSVTLRALANDVVIGLMGLTFVR